MRRKRKAETRIGLLAGDIECEVEEKLVKKGAGDALPLCSAPVGRPPSLVKGHSDNAAAQRPPPHDNDATRLLSACIT